jgi:hypothetical protein
MPDAQADFSHPVDRRMALAREWDELVAEVRRLPGFEDFLRPPQLKTLLPAAAEGPVVVINASRWRCDALVVNVDGVWIQELRGLSAADATERTNQYLRSHQETEQAFGAFVKAAQQTEVEHSAGAFQAYTAAKTTLQQSRAEMELMLRDVMAWLWDVVAEPVLNRLGFVDTPGPEQPWPHLWWCPTGALTLLPLHAAGYHNRDDGTHPRTVLDRVVSSYTPTVRALLDARRPADPAGDTRILAVALPDTPDDLPLPQVARERKLLTTLLPTDHLTLLEGSAATRANVQEQLPHHSGVHFSCHGGQNLADPSRGGLFLYDGMLTVADISAQHYRGEFAFLSACKTATGGIHLPDEAITLAAALHYTGYRHVIATLWSVYDAVAADVTEAVYTDLTSGGAFTPARSAYALHRATRELRDAHRDRPSVWTPFTHTGP